MTFRIGRRFVLRGLTGAAVGLPLLDAMGCTTESGELVRASTQALDPGGELAPQRLLVMVVPNGTDQPRFFPERRSDTDFDLGLCMQTTELVTQPTATLESLKPHLTILDGVTSYAGEADNGGHQSGNVSLLTGRRYDKLDEQTYHARGPSFDRVLGQHIADTSADAPADLVLALGTNNQRSWAGAVSYTGPGRGASKVSGARSLFDRLFGGFEGPDEAERRRLRRRSILDGTLGSYHRLRARLSGSDARRLDSHLEQIREVERRLDAQPRSCELPGEPAGINDRDGLDVMMRDYQELIPLAFACDLTRVVTFMVRTEGGTTRWVFPWLSFFDHCDPEGDYCLDTRGGAQSRNHHEMSHHYSSNPETRRDYLEIQQWHLAQYAGIVDGMRQRGVLDSSLCVYTSALGYGAHDNTRLPMLLAGSLGGCIEPGRALDVTGASNNDLWLSIMQAFGMEATSFGDPDFCSGPIPGLLA